MELQNALHYRSNSSHLLGDYDVCIHSILSLLMSSLGKNETPQLLRSLGNLNCTIMSRTYNYISKTYGYKYYGKSTSERTGCRRECAKAVRHQKFMESEGLSERELLDKEMQLYKSAAFLQATASEQQQMINEIDLLAKEEYSFICPVKKVKGTVCW